MREAIGGTWLLGLVLTFIVFFASFLAITVNYSKAFNVKNNVVDLISKYEGNNCNARKKIGSYMRNSGYLVTHGCPERNEVDNTCVYEGYDLNGDPVYSEKDAYYWVSKDTTDDTTVLDKKYYRVVVFFKIDLPLVEDYVTFRIKGETESIYFPKDEFSTKCSNG